MASASLCCEDPSPLSQEAERTHYLKEGRWIKLEGEQLGKP